VEQWKAVKDFEDRYWISSHGNVLSVKRKRTLKPRIRLGYAKVILNKKGKRTDIQVHRLVAQAFIPNLEGKPEVNHLDGNKINNRVANLEWCTRSENLKHAFRIGLRDQKGGKHPSAKLNGFQVQRIRLMRELANPPTYKEIGKMFNISIENVYRIAKRLNWKHI